MSGSTGNGGRSPSVGLRCVACGPRSTAKLIAAITPPAITNTPNAHRHDMASASNAPISGPPKAATPQTTEMIANSRGHIERGNSRSIDT
jgi:hypothetical protein